MLKVKIITPRGLYNEIEASKIHCTTTEGECALLPNHMPLVATLKISHLYLSTPTEEKRYAISGGLLQLNDNEVRILVDTIEGENEVDIMRAQRAIERAKKRLDRLDSNTSIKRAEVALEKAINRIKLLK